MAVQIPDPGTGNGQTGDNEYVFRKKVKDNFIDQTNAASRLVGTAEKNVMEVGAFGIGGTTPITSIADDASMLAELRARGTKFYRNEKSSLYNYPYSPALYINGSDSFAGLCIGVQGEGIKAYGGINSTIHYYSFYTDKNVTKDANGFLKGASPVIDMYDNKIDLNHNATEQGGITFEKLGVGDYLVKGSLGFAQEGWYIETPKDANGNVLVAVVYEQLANNDLSIKTYAKRFDEETGDVVPNLTKPRDIPTGRFISLRLHELPKEPQVMPNESQPEV